MKTTWPAMKMILATPGVVLHQSSDADGLSYRLKAVANGVVYECSVMLGEPEQADYEASYMAAAIKL